MRSLVTLALLLLSGCTTTSSELKKDPPRLLVAMERGACFGTCPMYRVEVFTDGRVRFTGERFVKATEPVESRLSAHQVEAIAARLAQVDFKWVDYANRDMTDMPTVILTRGDETIRHYRGDQHAPEGLTKLEDDLDALIGTSKWIKGEAVDR